MLAFGRETPQLDKLKARLDAEFHDSIKLQKRSTKDKERWLTQKEIDSVHKGVKS